MMKLVRTAVLMIVLAAAWAYLPFGGRSLRDRWEGSAGVLDFVGRTWAEMRGVAPGRSTGRSSPARAQARAAPRPGRPGERPAEGVTDDERRALDQLLTEHLRDPPPR
jgi:hypothetical protein